MIHEKKMNSDFCTWFCDCLSDSCERRKPEEIGIKRIQSLTIEESLESDQGSGNGSNYKIKQLFNKHGYNLCILQGHVRGKKCLFMSIMIVI